jgi:FkbM family methyltransferase
VASVAASLKAAVLRFLPDALLQSLKRVRYLAAVRSFWSQEAEVMVALVGRGDYVLDIGAHAGWYTQVLSKAVGPDGLVHSFEPIPSTFALLKFCVRGLRLRNVALFNCAASRDNGTAVMTVPQYPTGGENFYRASLLPEAEGPVPLRRFSVELRAVDSVLPAPARPIAFIKCDVEGHEADVLDGAVRTIERDRPALCIEVSGDPDDTGSSSHRLVSSLTRLGYETYWLHARHLVRRQPGDRSVNYFFLTENHRSRLVARGIPIPG